MSKVKGRVKEVVVEISEGASASKCHLHSVPPPLQHPQPPQITTQTREKPETEELIKTKMGISKISGKLVGTITIIIIITAKPKMI